MSRLFEITLSRNGRITDIDLFSVENEKEARSAARKMYPKCKVEQVVEKLKGKAPTGPSAADLKALDTSAAEAASAASEAVTVATEAAENVAAVVASLAETDPKPDGMDSILSLGEEMDGVIETVKAEFDFTVKAAEATGRAKKLDTKTARAAEAAGGSRAVVKAARRAAEILVEVGRTVEGM